MTGMVLSTGASVISTTERLSRGLARVSPPTRTASLTTVAYLALIAIFIIGCGGGVAVKDVPPVGQVWFGQSFDPATFALAGQRSTVGTQEPVALVAHLTKPVDGNVTIRASLNGALVATAPIAVTGSGEVFGYVLGALVTPGQWRYDIVDIGGNSLASGTVTAQ